MPSRIAVLGATGRMGREVARLVGEAGDLELVGGIAARSRGEAEARALGYPRIDGPEGAAAILADADVVVDFSSPGALAALARQESALTGLGLVTGTTGLGDEGLLEDIAGACPVVAAANFSVGVNVLLALVGRAARALPQDAWDVEIVEAHHRHKADAPSGTALALALGGNRCTPGLPR